MFGNVTVSALVIVWLFIKDEIIGMSYPMHNKQCIAERPTLKIVEVGTLHIYKIVSFLLN